MPFHKRPPRGYTQDEFPLPHNFEYHGGLTAHSTGANMTTCTLFRQSQAVLNIDAVEVNPQHGAFAEETGPTVAPASIIPKVMVNLHMGLTKLAIATDAIRALNVQVMPIYTAFVDSLIAADLKTGSEVEDILELIHGVGEDKVNPLFTGTDLAYQTAQPTSTVLDSGEAFGDWGLTTDLKLEGVNFDQGLYHDALSYFSNQGMLRKVAGKIMNFTLKQDHPARFFSHNFTQPMVKRANPYMFCGLMIIVQPVGTFLQYGRVGDSSAIDHVDFSLAVRFDEWNSQFDQTSL